MSADVQTSVITNKETIGKVILGTVLSPDSGVWRFYNGQIHGNFSTGTIVLSPMEKFTSQNLHTWITDVNVLRNELKTVPRTKEPSP